MQEQTGFDTIGIVATTRETAMARIRHIAIQTQDEEATKRFYVENFGLQVVRKLDSARTSGYFLTDGHINLAILRFKNDVVAGAERGTGWSGIHHIGFQVESLDETAAKLEKSGAAKPRDDINVALGLGAGGAPAGHGNVEVRYIGPDNVNFDISQTGWLGTPSNKARDEELATAAAAS
jgi:glyoxylase I family protein